MSVLCASLALGAGSASARPFGAAEETAWAEAESYWQAAPTLCRFTVREIVPPGSLDNPAAGEIGVRGRATQPTYPQGCVFYIVDGLDAIDLCSIVRHEYGHLLGYGHEDPELADLPTCSWYGDEQAVLREAWVAWRKKRDRCRWSRGPYRPKCWAAVRSERKRIIAIRESKT